MSFHVRRSNTASEQTLYQWSNARSTTWVKPLTGHSVLEIQTTHNPEVFLSVPDDKNVLIPPPHWHWYQDEYFHIRQGRYLFTLEGKTFPVSASDPQPVRIPATARHTFKVDPTHQGPCTIEISTDTSPLQDGKADVAGASERFFRCIYSYLDDCHSQKVAPSLPQLLLMLHDAEISLAFPGPAWLMRWVSWGFGLVIGKGVGQYLLGYRSTYPEYYDPLRENKAAAGNGVQQQQVLGEGKKVR
ncbi:hypothetical protein K461DRAFT_146181 [Myriangium duriaei CBS 260.36]|uniref:Uncharacterized protein n=1 Tax=Myriangium duriaei CBS 260.36 TaxID=1168546 RepID=A0A9P4IZF3_9PEZI|nr:hypothetical protein K461DRAFT_146181 [Myriangium duriaei CBS 260.36]